MPSCDKVRTAFIPSSIIGILTTTFCPSIDSFRASSHIPFASFAITSRLTGPSTIERISFIVPSGSFFSFARRLGLVVTPSTRPISIPFLISSVLAVSIKNFIDAPPLSYVYWRFQLFGLNLGHADLIVQAVACRFIFLQSRIFCN
ncbi:MAG: hypothetical protein A4E62_03184 [Syntrophorhabdus sp. PtaU1.Bin002]|nr:MAG: hypothetical protein A4E62_03184 [Syntrophorhabdus sp. PtaU1.Bin002]